MEKVKFENTQIPLHYQIADYLLELLSRGDLDPEERLLPEEELREIFGVSRTTIRRALEHLLNKGLLYRKQGRGTFWTQAAHDLRHEKLSGVNRQIFNIKEETTVQVLSKAKEKGLSDVNTILNLDPESEVIVFKRIRFDNSEPMSYTINYLPVEYGNLIKEEHLEKMTMLETLEKVLQVDLGTIQHEVEITRANTVIAEKLKIAVLDPVLTVKTQVFDINGKQIEVVWTHFVETKYKFRVVLDK